MTENKLMYIVSYDEWVDEGDNTGGWSGYRNFQKIFLNVKDFTEWLDKKIDYHGAGKLFKLTSIESSSYTKPSLLDMRLEIDRSRQRLEEKRVEEEEKRLLAEQKKVEKKLQELRRQKTKT